MSPDFLFANFNTIALAIWFIFFCIVVLRFVRFSWVKDISYNWFIAAAIILHLLYGIFATWGQYLVWAKGDMTKILLSAPLPKEVPFFATLEWLRPVFSGSHGYFAYYAFQHFFLSAVVLFGVTGLFVAFLKTYAKHRASIFQEGDIAVIALAFLIAGWPGVVVLIPLAFIIAIMLLLKLRTTDRVARINLSAAFLLALPVILLFNVLILDFLNLYSLLKL